VVFLKLLEFSHRELAEVHECNERTIRRRIGHIREV